MQAYDGYFDNGHFITKGKLIEIPCKKRVILTVLDEPIHDDNDHLDAWLEFIDNIKNIQNEPVSEFERVKFREVDI